MAKNETQRTLEQDALAKTIAFADTDWQTITEADAFDFSLANEPYPLPDEAKKYQEQKKFAFRWIEDSSTRLKEVMKLQVPEKWWPCNRVNTPFLSKYCDSLDGAVHCKDQILVFKPWWMHMKKKEMYERPIEAKLASGMLASKNGIKESGVEWSSGEKCYISEGDDIMGEVPDDLESTDFNTGSDE